MFRPVVVIPVYNHGVTAVKVIASVVAHGLPCIVVDDGSRPDSAALLDEASRQPGVQLLRLPRNCGKGGAVLAGFHSAAQQGFTHALQIDADGQHDTADIPDFIRLAQQHPQAVVCGVPLYDASVPKGRLYGRYVTHVWVWVHTLSFAIRDSMCGFRVYPMQAVSELMRKVCIGQRMDFDTEVLVRLHWRGVPVVNRPTRVVYPQGGLSNFDVWRDNLRISRMHAKLFFGMLLRLPLLLARKVV
jgi:glycosyltransferase involved in cell wall biosynthesis